MGPHALLFGRKGRRPGGHRSLFRKGYDLFGLDSSARNVELTKLTSLSLGGISLGAHPKRLFRVLDISNLRTLKLQDCPNSYAFLKEVIHSKPPVRLKHFELVEDVYHGRLQGAHIVKRDPRDSEVENIASFLKSFWGLVDLLVVIPSYWQTSQLVDSILHHKRTLRRLIIHPRSLRGLDHPFFVDEDVINETTPMQLSKESRDLDCIGTCHWRAYAVRVRPKPRTLTAD